jgi:RNA polymerase sigma factor (sigma-70 family)
MEKGETEEALLHQVQSYLHQRGQQQFPDQQSTEAWDEFYGVYQAIITALIRVHRLDREEKQDVAQEVWSQVLVSLPVFICDETRSRFKVWLSRVVANKVNDLFRRKGRQPGQSLENVAEGEHDVAANSADPSILLDRPENGALLRRALAHLRAEVPEINFRVLELHWLEERPVAEVATVLNLTEKQVLGRQNRMFARLREIISNYLDPEDSLP